MKKGMIVFLICVSLLNLLLFGYNLSKSNQAPTNAAIPEQNIHGNFDVNQGGVSTQSTPDGDLWIYISSMNRVYFVTKPDSAGQIKSSFGELQLK